MLRSSLRSSALRTLRWHGNNHDLLPLCGGGWDRLLQDKDLLKLASFQQSITVFIHRLPLNPPVEGSTHKHNVTVNMSFCFASSLLMSVQQLLVHFLCQGKNSNLPLCPCNICTNGKACEKKKKEGPPLLSCEPMNSARTHTHTHTRCTECWSVAMGFLWGETSTVFNNKAQLTLWEPVWSS